MPCRIMGFALLLIPMFIANLRADQPITAGKAADPAHIQKLIDNLGSTSYIERERAGKELEAIGPAALSELRKAVTSRDLELSSRAARLVDRLEEKALIASLLTGKRVRLKVNDVSVVTAVAELQKLSGQQFDVTGNHSGRKITLDTGEVTVWEALQQLCEKTGMIEQVAAVNRHDLSPMLKSPLRYPQQPTQNRSIVLVEGTQKLPPTCFAGSVRVRALPANSAGIPRPGEVNVVLEAVGEQRLQSFGIVDALFFDKSIDDQGQRLELVPENPLANQTPFANPNFQRIMIVNGNLVPLGGADAHLHAHRGISLQAGAQGGQDAQGTVRQAGRASAQTDGGAAHHQRSA